MAEPLEPFTEYDKALLREAARLLVDVNIGLIRLHPLTRKNVEGQSLALMIVEEPAVWEE